MWRPYFWSRDNLEAFTRASAPPRRVPRPAALRPRQSETNRAGGDSRRFGPSRDRWGCVRPTVLDGRTSAPLVGGTGDRRTPVRIGELLEGACSSPTAGLKRFTGRWNTLVERRQSLLGRRGRRRRIVGPPRFVWNCHRTGGAGSGRSNSPTLRSSTWSPDAGCAGERRSRGR